MMQIAVHRNIINPLNFSVALMMLINLINKLIKSNHSSADNISYFKSNEVAFSDSLYCLIDKLTDKIYLFFIFLDFVLLEPM